MARVHRGFGPSCFLILLLAAAPALAQDHQYSSDDIATGVRVYNAQCALCHGPNGDMVNRVDLRRGRFRRAVTDGDLAAVITGGVPEGGMPGFSLSKDEVTGLVAFIRAGFDPGGTAVKVGDIARGRQVFAGKGKCATCHRVGGDGPRAAPELTDIGALRTPASIQRSLLDPTAGLLPINRAVRIVTRDGRTLRGRRLNEDTFSVQLVTDREQLVSVEKSNITEFEVSPTATMPSVEGSLSGEEVADLVAYLLSLRGTP
ncbi:MAG: c-type cytochrome [Vicinamibacterales bacterium]